MMILAIDPGNKQSAFVTWNGKEITWKGIVPNEEMREVIIQSRLLTVIEMVASYGMPVGITTFETVLWIGRFVELAPSYDLVYRKDVKMHLCNSMRAKDSNIIQALKDRFEPDLQPRCRPKGVLKGVSKDVWQAMAVAVTWWDLNQEDL